MREELVEVGRDQPRQEQEQASELGAQMAWRQVELADIGHLGLDGTGLDGPLVVGSPWQLGEPLLLQDGGDGRRAERGLLSGQGEADVVDGEVLLPEGDDLLSKPVLLSRRSSLACGGGEEVRLESDCGSMDEDTKAGGRIAESPGRLGGWDAVNEEGPEGFVLPMGGVGGLQEPASQR